MTEHGWQDVKKIFLDALEKDADERERFLDETCNGDGSQRSEVESLLASHFSAESFIETPAFQISDALKNKPIDLDQQFGNYTIIREIGAGGMGAVFLAKRSDGEFDQMVAIKIVRQAIAESHLIDQFKRERQILAPLNHPNIARMLDGGVSDDGRPFLAMEHVEGGTITEFADAQKLDVRGRVKLFLKVCSAVVYAHRNLIVHRDLKPNNILVTSDGEPKLLDFGLAKLIDETLPKDSDHTQTAFRALTPAYASPEQMRGDPITTASDIYSLGVMLYELLTGSRPFQTSGKSVDQIIRTFVEAVPSLPSRAVEGGSQLKGDLDNIVLTALRTEPERRYRSVEQFADDLTRYLDGRPVSARPNTFGYRATKFIGRNRIAVVAALLILITVLAGITMTIREKQKADRRFNDVRQLANSLMFEVDSEIQKGPTKGRVMIAKRALEYLDSLAVESGNPADLQIELAAGYLKVGDIQGKPYRPNIGDNAGAEESYHKARVMLESLFAAEPANRDAQYYLSITYQSLGRVQERNSKWDLALESERQAVAISESLVTSDPANEQYRDLLADNYLHFGEALYQAGRGATIADHHTAIDYFRKALAIHTELAEANTNNADFRYAMGVDYEYIGIAFNRLGEMTGDLGYHSSALENHLKEQAINEALANSDPSNAAYRRIVADVYGEVGLSQLKLGRPAEALENFRHKLGIFEAAKASDPTNVEAIRDVVNSLTEIGNVMTQLGDVSGALIEMRKAAALQLNLSLADPSGTLTRVQLQTLSDSIEKLEKQTAKNVR